METHQQTTEVEGRNQSTHAQPQQQQQAIIGAAAATANANASSSPPVLSASSSPSHEFSFTISLHSSTTTATTTTTTTKASSSSSLSAKSTTKSSPALSIDLSPADEIFYHGHLLPLHFVSHLHSSSPRPSTHSLDDFSFPNTDEKPLASTTTATPTAAAASADNSTIPCNSGEENYNISFNKDYAQIHNTRTSIKSKSFSLFGLPKWKKASESVTTEKSEGTTTEKCNKRKLKFEVTQFLKKYLKMVKPLLSPNKGGRQEAVRVRRQSYSFSGIVSPRDHKREVIRGMRRGEYSAPASMRTSPTNSGLLLATAGVPSPVSESTMEELQAAIQAAIAHCKNSISTEEKSQELSSVPVN